MVGDEGRHSAGRGDLTAACEHLPALRIRLMGGSLAQESGEGRLHCCPVRRRSCGGFRKSSGGGRFLEEFRERLAKFGLELRTEKTRLIEFGRFAAQNRERRGAGKPETFTFLGFTHYCGKRRKDGAFILWRETAKRRLVAKLQAIKTDLKRRRHEPIASVGAWLRRVTSGYYQYHAVPGNLPRLELFRWRLRWVWWHALSRRSQRSQIPMDRLTRLLAKWIPVPRVLHPYPMQRFDASHPRREPYA